MYLKEDKEKDTKREKDGEKEGEKLVAYLPAAKLLAVYTELTGGVLK